jgi:hypothetical protein
MTEALMSPAALPLEVNLSFDIIPLPAESSQ